MHVKDEFNQRGINNFEFLPLITDKRSHLDSRVYQFKRGMERIVDKYQKKAHVVGYSFAGLIPRTYIGLHNGEDYIKSLLTISSPNKGCRYADILVNRPYEEKMYMIEPVIRSLGLHIDWFKQEYPSKMIYDMATTFTKTDNVKFYSVGGRKQKIKASEPLRVISEDLNDDLLGDHPNDGLICIDEAEYDNHLINFDADHYELIGMRPGFNSNAIFDLYAETVKSNDESFNKYFNLKEETIKYMEEGNKIESKLKSQSFI
jgi:hypothetical protein